MKYLIGFFLVVLSLMPISHAALTDFDRAEFSSQNAFAPVNAGFESNKAGWTCLPALAFSSTTPMFPNGKQYAQWDSTSTGQTCRSAAVTLPRTGTCSAHIWTRVPSGTATHTISIVGASVLSSNSIVSTSAASKQVLPAFACPSSGTVYLEIESIAANEPSIDLDGARIGELISVSKSSSSSFITNPGAEDGVSGWQVYIDYLTAVSADLLGDSLDVQKTNAIAPEWLNQAGDLPTSSKLRYLGLTPFGGLTVGNDYFVDNIGGTGTNLPWGLKFRATVGGSIIDITSNAGAGLSGFVPYEPIAGINGNYGTPDLTWTRTTTDPLVGDASFVLTKPAFSTLGQGVSVDFKIDRALMGQGLRIDFAASVTSGTFAANDLQVWIYDKTNRKKVRLFTPATIDPSKVQQKMLFIAPTNSVDYRLILHSSTTSASAYTLKLDDFVIDKQINIGTGIISTPWQAYTPVITGLGTGSVASSFGMWRRVGDTLEIMYNWTKDGSNGTGSSPIYTSLPSGFTPDTSKMPNAAAISDGEVFASLNLSLSQLVESNGSGGYWVNRATGTIISGGFVTGGSYFRGSFSIPVKEFGAASNIVNPANNIDLTGMVFYTAASVCPVGSVALDGGTSPRTGATAPLFAKIGTTYGAGDGSTTFNRPDARGIFIRGAGSQTISGTTYTGTLATKQTDQFQGHWHTLDNGFAPNVRWRNNLGTGSAGGGIATDDAAAPILGARGVITNGANGTPRIGNETQPANISLTPCISIQPTVSAILANSVVSRDNPDVTTVNTYKIVSAAYTATVDDETIQANTTGNYTIALPPAATVKGKKYHILWGTGGTNSVQIDPSGSEQICGQSTISIYGLNDQVTIQSTGTAWVGLEDSCKKTEWFATGAADCTSGACSILSRSHGATITYNSTGNYAAVFGYPFSFAPTCTFANYNANLLTCVSGTASTSAVAILCYTPSSLANGRPGFVCTGYR